MRRIVMVVSPFVALVVGGLAWWRWHPRTGSAWVNRVVDPWLVRQGIIDESEGELGLIEHVGRISGIVRVSPVHPVRTEDGFRIVVPLGVASHWAANVVAAGRCRLQVGDVVHELDQPSLVSPSAVAGIPPFAGRMMDVLGFRYLLLRRIAETPGALAIDARAPAEPVLAAA